MAGEISNERTFSMVVTLVLVDLSAGLVCRQTGVAEEGSGDLGRNCGVEWFRAWPPALGRPQGHRLDPHPRARMIGGRSNQGLQR